MTTDAVGGVWNYSLELTRYLSGMGSEVHLCVLGPAPDAPQLEATAAVGVASVSVSGLPLEWTAKSEPDIDALAMELQASALKWKADLVHLNAPAQTGMQSWPMPLTVTAHSCVGTWWLSTGKGPMPRDLAWRARRTGVGITLANAVIAPSKAFARDLAAIYGELIPISPVYNGRLPFASAPAEPDDIVLAAGRLWDQGKNFAVIDEAARIGGEDIYAAGAKIGPNGQTIDLSHLRLLGNLGAEAMAAWHRRAGIFISMSKYEPFGLAVLEAAQSGSALVLADIPTFRELWYGAAILINPNDAVQLSETIRRIKTNPAERRELGAAAQHRANIYTAEAMGEQTTDVYALATAAHGALTSERAGA